MKSIIATLSIALGAAALSAANPYPIVQTSYTADPAPMVHNDTVFLYTSHDEDTARGYNFEMYDWLLYTSTDMVNWTDHGPVASLKEFKWNPRENGAWAIQVVERNGKFYMYCPIHGNGIGVLVADSPYGPFKDPIGKPLVWQKEHWNDIDPTVLIDDDGQAYMYWGNPELYAVKLNEDMTSTSGEIIQFPRIQDYQEGPWIWKRDGHYYLAFASTCCPEGIGYAMSENPLGPWEYKGHIMDHTPRTRGNHPGIIDYKGRSYVFGHSYDVLRKITDEHSERRSVEAAEMTYNPDGTIAEVPYWRDATLEPCSTIDPYKPVEAATMAYGFGLKTGALGDHNRYTGDIDAGEYMVVRNVDFGDTPPKRFELSAATTYKGCMAELRAGGIGGRLIGLLEIGATGSTDEYAPNECDVHEITGVQDLYIIFHGPTGGADTDLFRIDQWKFAH